MDQLVPFQSSTSPPVPTAKQTFARGHETPFSEVKVEPGGLGVGTICQLAPSQRSATVTSDSDCPPREVAWPTAMHEFADEQSTALRLVLDASATFGVGGTVQAANAAAGVSNSAAVANKTKRSDRSDISPSTYASGLGGSTPLAPFRALDVCERIAEDGHPVTARRCDDPPGALLWAKSGYPHCMESGGFREILLWAMSQEKLELLRLVLAEWTKGTADPPRLLARLHLDPWCRTH
jgi:hypothetical protein